MVRIIETEACLAEGVAHLRRRDRAFRPVLKLAGPPPLRRRDPGFEGLCAIIVSQQLSVASAAAIWARCEAAFRPMTPQALLAAGDADFAGAGLSRPKVRTLRAISEAVAAGALPLDRLEAMNPEDAHAALVAVKGIGPWTADIYLMFCLGHADAFAPGDLALQEAARIAFALSERPSAQELAERAEVWRPWRWEAAG